MASIAGTAFLRAPSALLWEPAALSNLPVVSSGALLTLHQMTREIVWTMARMGASANYRPELNSADENTSRRIIGVEWLDAPSLIGREGIDRRQVIEPIAAHLAERFTKDKMTTCGKLLLPQGAEATCWVHDPASGLHVRGTQLFDIAERRHRVMFDLLVASA